MTLQTRTLMFDSMWPGDDLAQLAREPPKKSATDGPEVRARSLAPASSSVRVVRDEAPRQEEPAPAGPCFLSVGASGDVAIHPLGEEAIIGRDPEVAIHFPVDDVSRRHARIRRGPAGRYFVEDLRSVNGTTLNGRPVQQAELTYGDRLGIGRRVVLLFAREPPRPIERPAPAPAAEPEESMVYLARSAAHDFNTLLTAVTASAGYLRALAANTSIAAAEVQEALVDIEEATRRATEVTSHLLTFMQGTEEPRLANISALLEEQVRAIRRSSEAAIDVVTDIYPNIFVKAGAWPLGQVLNNVFARARAAIPPGGRLALEAKIVELREVPLGHKRGLSPGRHLLLSVGLGEGVSQPEPLRSISETTDLGLAAATTIVEEHQGRLVVEGKLAFGARVLIYLPLAEGSPAAAGRPRSAGGARDAGVPAPVAARTAAGDHRGVLLLVEAEPLVRRSTERILRRFGWEVLSTDSAEDAAQALRDRRREIAVVLLDATIQPSAADALAALRMVDSDAPIVAVFGAPDAEAERDVIAAGAHAVVSRPYELPLLDEVLAGAARPLAGA